MGQRFLGGCRVSNVANGRGRLRVAEGWRQRERKGVEDWGRVGESKGSQVEEHPWADSMLDTRYGFHFRFETSPSTCKVKRGIQSSPFPNVFVNPKRMKEGCIQPERTPDRWTICDQEPDLLAK